MIQINGDFFEADNTKTIIQVCDLNEIFIPRFCYHKSLSISGNCRMCLVEIENKLVPSCNTFAKEGIQVFTESTLVNNARKSVMELLLINHPLDCPICDQGGNCDLQNYAVKYGFPKGRFNLKKRTFQKKDLGPLINETMNRCILCTRCVRFSKEIARENVLAVHGRGFKSELVANAPLLFELSGNLIDICPVGALSEKPNAAATRPWELTQTETIDVMDSFCNKVILHSKKEELIKITPKEGFFITNKSRFSHDGLKYQRLDKPMIKKNGKFEEITYDEAIETVSDQIKYKKGLFLSGNFTDLESIMLTQIICNHFDHKYECRNNDFPTKNFLFNSDLKKIEEIWIFDFDIKQSSLLGMIPHVKKIIDLKNLDLFNTNAKYPALIIGEKAFKNNVKTELNNFIYNMNLIKDDFNGVNVIARYPGLLNGISSNFISDTLNDDFDFYYLLGCNEKKINTVKKSFIIYQGSHFDFGASQADIIIPSSPYTEKVGTYLNIFGKYQKTKPFKNSKTKNDFEILSIIYSKLGFNASKKPHELSGESLYCNDLLLVRQASEEYFGILASRYEHSCFEVKYVSDHYYFDNVIGRNSLNLASVQNYLQTKKQG